LEQLDALFADDKKESQDPAQAALEQLDALFADDKKESQDPAQAALEQLDALFADDQQDPELDSMIEPPSTRGLTDDLNSLDGALQEEDLDLSHNHVINEEDFIIEDATDTQTRFSLSRPDILTRDGLREAIKLPLEIRQQIEALFSRLPFDKDSLPPRPVLLTRDGLKAALTVLPQYRQRINDALSKINLDKVSLPPWPVLLRHSSSENEIISEEDVVTTEKRNKINEVLSKITIDQIKEQINKLNFSDIPWQTQVLTAGTTITKVALKMLVKKQVKSMSISVITEVLNTGAETAPGIAAAFAVGKDIELIRKGGMAKLYESSAQHTASALTTIKGREHKGSESKKEFDKNTPDGKLSIPKKTFRIIGSLLNAFRSASSQVAMGVTKARSDVSEYLSDFEDLDTSLTGDDLKDAIKEKVKEEFGARVIDSEYILELGRILARLRSMGNYGDIDVYGEEGSTAKIFGKKIGFLSNTVDKRHTPEVMKQLHLAINELVMAQEISPDVFDKVDLMTDWQNEYNDVSRTRKDKLRKFWAISGTAVSTFTTASWVSSLVSKAMNLESDWKHEHQAEIQEDIEAELNLIETDLTPIDLNDPVFLSNLKQGILPFEDDLDKYELFRDGNNIAYDTDLDGSYDLVVYGNGTIGMFNPDLESVDILHIPGEVDIEPTETPLEPTAEPTLEPTPEPTETPVEVVPEIDIEPIDISDETFLSNLRAGILPEQDELEPYILQEATNGTSYDLDLDGAPDLFVMTDGNIHLSSNGVFENMYNPSVSEAVESTPEPEPTEAPAEPTPSPTEVPVELTEADIFTPEYLANLRAGTLPTQEVLDTYNIVYSNDGIIGYDVDLDGTPDLIVYGNGQIGIFDSDTGNVDLMYNPPVEELVDETVEPDQEVENDSSQSEVDSTDTEASQAEGSADNTDSAPTEEPAQVTEPEVAETVSADVDSEVDLTNLGNDRLPWDAIMNSINNNPRIDVQNINGTTNVLKNLYKALNLNVDMGVIQPDSSFAVANALGGELPEGAVGWFFSEDQIENLAPEIDRVIQLNNAITALDRGEVLSELQRSLIDANPTGSNLSELQQTLINLNSTESVVASTIDELNRDPDLFKEIMDVANG